MGSDTYSVSVLRNRINIGSVLPMVWDTEAKLNLTPNLADSGIMQALNLDFMFIMD